MAKYDDSSGDEPNPYLELLEAHPELLEKLRAVDAAAAKRRRRRCVAPSYMESSRRKPS